MSVLKMDNIIQCIYKSCDSEGKNVVRVSTLVDFIQPYMSTNLTELTDLQLRLDPDNVNPDIDYGKFESAMSDWIASMQGTDSNNSFTEFSVNLTQTFNLNISQASCDENKSNNNNNIIGTNFEEEIKKLKHQLNKANAELDLVKQQLATCEDQNDCLMADLKLYSQNKNKEQIHSEDDSDLDHSGGVAVEKIESVSKKCDQLEKLLCNQEKQQEKYLNQVTQLENENQRLQEKLQTMEKLRKDHNRSVIEMRDTLDVKESEIITLLEILESLKGELTEKNDLLSFYMNECKCLKQRTRDLENLLQINTSYRNVSSDDFKDVFNTPKLLKQLQNPVTPSFNTPTKSYNLNTSSPVKNSNNSSSFDYSLSSGAETITVLRCPHKTLKEEFAEISESDNNGEDCEVARLYKLVKDQEDIKNNLWQNIKQLSSDNETLLDYRKEYVDLKCQMDEKDRLFRDTVKELELIQQREKFYVDRLEKSRLINEHITLELTAVEHNLNEQILLNKGFQENLKALKASVDKKGAQKKALVRGLLTKLKFTQHSLEKQMIENECLRNNLIRRNTMVDQSSETDKVVVSASKSNNYSKQQMRIEKLVNKLEKNEKDLANERNINTKLNLKYQEKCREYDEIKNSFETYRSGVVVQQEETLKKVTMEKEDLSNKLQTSTKQNENFHTEINFLKDQNNSLQLKIHSLDENLRDALNRLTFESAVSCTLRTENEYLANAEYHLKNKMREELNRQFDFKKQLIDSRSMHELSARQFQKEIMEQRVEIRSLKKQLEVCDCGFFVASWNDKLKSNIDSIFARVSFDDAMSILLANDAHLHSENEMIILERNIELVVSLLQSLTDKCVELMKKNETDEDDRFENSTEDGDLPFDELDEDIVNTFAEEVPEIHSALQTDSFLNNLQLEPGMLKYSSLKEMEEKFTNLALLLTVDLAHLNKKCDAEKEKFDLLMIKFFAYLNYSIHLLCGITSPEIRISKRCLSNLRILSEDLIRSAIANGTLSCEKRTLYCWRLVINYVAHLRRDKQKTLATDQTLTKQPDLKLEDIPNDFMLSANCVSSPTSLTSYGSTLKILIYVLLIVFILLFSLMFYVEYKCPRNGKRACPLPWIVNYFVEKTYSSKLQV